MSLSGLLNQSVSWYSRGSYGADGRPAYSTATTIRARLEARAKRVLLPNGTVVNIDALLIVAPSHTITSDDKISFDSVDYRVLDIFKVPGGDGTVHHQEIKLAKWPTA